MDPPGETRLRDPNTELTVVRGSFELLLLISRSVHLTGVTTLTGEELWSADDDPDLLPPSQGLWNTIQFTLVSSALALASLLLRSGPAFPLMDRPFPGRSVYSNSSNWDVRTGALCSGCSSACRCSACTARALGGTLALGRATGYFAGSSVALPSGPSRQREAAIALLAVPPCLDSPVDPSRRRSRRAARRSAIAGRTAKGHSLARSSASVELSFCSHGAPVHRA